MKISGFYITNITCTRLLVNVYISHVLAIIKKMFSVGVMLYDLYVRHIQCV